jgi:hypothetical protein
MGLGSKRLFKTDGCGGQFEIGVDGWGKGYEDGDCIIDFQIWF